MSRGLVSCFKVITYNEATKIIIRSSMFRSFIHFCVLLAYLLNIDICSAAVDFLHTTAVANFEEIEDNLSPLRFSNEILNSIEVESEMKLLNWFSFVSNFVLFLPYIF